MPRTTGKATEKGYLVRRIDVFAEAILTAANKEENLPLDKKLDVLDKLAKWVAVRNRLVGDDEEGNGLNGIRNKLKGNAAGRTLPSLGKRPGDFVTQRYGRRPQEDQRRGDGAGLADLKSRIPRADAGGDDDDRDDAEREDDSDALDDRGVHPDVSGDQPGDDNGADRGRDV